MRRETQVRILREVLRAVRTGRPPLDPVATRNDPSIYTSADRQALEERVLFGHYPLVAGVAARARHAGDWFTDDLAPVPTLVVRGHDERLRAFANACRHRGARIAEGHGNSPQGFSCPYHGWCYGLDGSLEEIPEAYGFKGLDRGAHGLVELPVEERYGLAWVHPSPGARFDIARSLGALADDLESSGADRHHLHASHTVCRQMNWKLASDTFWEAYHVKALHAPGLGPPYARNIGHTERFGPHHRFVSIRSSVTENHGRPESEWDLVSHATILNHLFPNTIYIMQKDHIEIFRIFPVWGRYDQCVTEVNILTCDRDPRWDDLMAQILSIIDQDGETGEGIQRNFEAGILPHVNYGRYEGALEHFHRSIREALAGSDDVTEALGG